MRALLALVLSIQLSTPAAADWEFTRWGMTVEQVQAASGNTLDTIPEYRRPGMRIGATLPILEGVFKAGAFRFYVNYHFDAQGMLELVDLQPDNYTIGREIESALLARYGRPIVDKSGGSCAACYEWQDLERGNVVNFYRTPSINSIRLRYTRLDAAAARKL